MTRTLIIALTLAASMAQAPADDSRPASSNVLNAQYPRVHPDGRVTFRLTAPNAQKVQLQPGGADNGLGKGPIDMTRDEKGLWSITLPRRRSRLPLLLVPRRRPHRQRSRQRDVLRLGPADERNRGARAGRRLLRRAQRPARRGTAAAVRVQGHRRLAASLRLHAARLRRQRQGPLPGALPPARRRRERDELDQAGPRQPDPRQPDRRRQGQADDRGDGHRLRDQTRRHAGAGRHGHAAGPQRIRGRRRLRI